MNQHQIHISFYRETVSRGLAAGTDVISKHNNSGNSSSSSCFIISDQLNEPLPPPAGLDLSHSITQNL